MSRITWDEAGKRLFETGVDHAVLYPVRSGRYQKGVAWNGVTAVSESSSGAEATPLYADNIKYLNLLSGEDFKATIEAYHYPEEFQNCIGKNAIADGVVISQQKRQSFGLCYRTILGNDRDGIDGDYKIHIVFQCLAGPSDVSYSTVNDSPEAITYSWEVSTTPVEVPGYKPTAVLVLNSRRFRKTGLMNILHHLEDILFGTDESEPTFPTIASIIEVDELERYLRDSSNEAILDSAGNRIQSRVFS